MLGNMQVSRVLPYQWYDTPNATSGTLDDFEDFLEHIATPRWKPA